MKKIIVIFSVLLAGITLFSCANGMDEIGTRKSSRNAESGYATDNTISPVADGYLRINTLSTTADNLWIWNDFDPSATAECTSWNDATGGYKSNKGKNGDFVYFDIKLSDAPQQVGFIVRKGTTKLSGDADIIYLFPAKYKEIFLKNGSGKIYIDSACTKEPAGLASALITGEHKITATISGITLSGDNVKVFKSDKTTEIKSTVASNVITVEDSLKEVGTVYVRYTDEIGTDERIANFDSSLVDEWFADVDISKLGYKDGGFTTWAPFASTAKVLLFADAEKTSGDDYEVATEIPMTRNKDGTFSTGNVSAKVGSNKYYKYSFMNNGVQYDVCDIWAKVASKDSTASAIESISTNKYESSYKNPFGNTGTEQKLYSDAVIYEMHITDWSQAFRTSVEKDKPGTFKEITDALGKNGSGEFAQHLKGLGVTHVQILPMFEYAVTTKGELKGDKVEFTENDNAYNWGYNPYNYNTPESRYVEDMHDGSDAVDQMREMIATFHKAGIAVIMDVVYNHTAGTGNGSIYDMTVPKYFYRMDSQGNYSNGSGCGNETATNHEMVKKYVIDSLKHWMNDYHINGFRFDLMGIHESKTMQEIYEELSKIDKNVMVYGEPWTAEGHPDDSCEGAVAASAGGNGVGAFDDNFRDAIKGGEYSGFGVGQIQTANSDSGIINGLTGKSSRNTTGKPGLALHYVECHDNFTLYDKLVYSLEETLSAVQAADKTGNIATQWPTSVSNEQIELIKKQNKLAAAYVILAQGTPFINGGQEFLRTKKGDPDSYAADKKGGVFWSNIDEVNAINLSFKNTNSDVYNTYKGLIALRKSSPAFTNGTDSTAKTLSKGVTLYNAKSGSDEYEVIFNATDSDYTLTDTNIEGQIGLAVNDYEVSFSRKGKRVTISETDGKVSTADTETTVSTVPAKSFVILKK